MAQARSRKSPAATAALAPLTAHLGRGIREAVFLLSLALAAYFVISLTSYHPADPGWSHTGGSTDVRNAGGVVGAWIADVLLYLLGYLAYLLPVMIVYSGWLLLRAPAREAGEGARHGLLAVRWTGFVLVLIAGCALGSMHFVPAPDSVPLDAGGVLGQLAGIGSAGVVGPLGATLLHLALFLAGVTLFTGLSWFTVMDSLGGLTLRAAARLRELAALARERLELRRARQEREEVVSPPRERAPRRKPVRIEPTVPRVEPGARVQKERQMPLFEPVRSGDIPPLSLLDPPPPRQGGYSEQALEAMSRLLEMKLQDFGVQVEVESVQPGPVITRFELQPAPGVKVSQITNLAKDLARALSVISVRVVEVIPGKSVIGLEVPNEQRELVVLSEILRSAAYDQSASPLTLAMGKDISGAPVVADLARMPHLLVAGTTGSGKSVAINAMLLSLLFKARPDQVRLILIDPKMLELNVYEGVPHLLTPVVTDMKDAANALRWCVGEMERRYQLMASQGVRNIAGYNRKVREAIEAGKPIVDPLYDATTAFDPEAPPPSVVPVPGIWGGVDVVAEGMLVVGKKVEELIARLAQKARASGIHLILATQRPSVDVITGLIKANIPSRVAFQVSSKVDSRTILDQMGAEQLLGHGDMLFLPPGTALPRRVHGAYVADHEVHKVVGALKAGGQPDYLDEILQEGQDVVLPGEQKADADGGEADPLYDEAVAIVTESRKASISYVQRRLKIGYNRAARMIEEMETAGVVSPVQANGSREVLAQAPPAN